MSRFDLTHPHRSTLLHVCNKDYARKHTAAPILFGISQQRDAGAETYFRCPESELYTWAKTKFKNMPRMLQIDLPYQGDRTVHLRAFKDLSAFLYVREQDGICLVFPYVLRLSEYFQVTSPRTEVRGFSFPKQ